MSKENKKLHVAIVLDKSGSMWQTKQAAIEGYNEQVQQLKINQENGLETEVCLITFNGQVFEHLWCVPAAELTEIGNDDYTPNGATALRDAMGYTIKKLMDTTDWEDENNIYLVIAISDGDSMSDKHYGAAELKEIIGCCQATDRWTFTHMGCSEDYLKEMAKETGIPVANYAAWDNASIDSTRGGMRRAAGRTQQYCASVASGASVKSANFMSDVSDEVADFTAPIEDDAVIDVAKPKSEAVNLASALKHEAVAQASHRFRKSQTQIRTAKKRTAFSDTKAVVWPVEEEVEAVKID